jgi:hypothetical protein
LRRRGQLGWRLRGNRWRIRDRLPFKVAIVSNVGYIVVRLVRVTKKIVVIGWKRWKVLAKVKDLICRLAIVCWQRCLLGVY